MIVADILSKGNPARQLLIFSCLGITALVIGMLADGLVSVYAFISVGLFCSTLWPCIFTLAVAGLGKHTSEGSNFLIMMIMGGGVISVLQGYLASPAILGIQFSYVVGEEKEEVIQTMRDLRESHVDVITIGQYLQPSKKHLAVNRFVHPDEFAAYRHIGYELGFDYVESGPLVRSSYHSVNRSYNSMFHFH